MSLLLSALFFAATSSNKPIRDELFVRLKQPTSVERLAVATAKFGRIEERITGTSIFVIELKPGAEAEDLTESLTKLPGVSMLGEQEERALRLKSGRPLRESESGQKPGLDSPDEAMKWRHLAWVDGHGQIPPDAMRKALAQKSRMKQVNHSKLRGDVWQNEGPADLAGRSLIGVVDPKNPQRIWLGTAGGGIWRSLDGGLTWTPIGDGLQSLAVCALTLDPNDNTTLYAGTGEGYHNIDAVAGGGIYKSIDGGDTWTQLPGTINWNWHHINRIAICPGNSKTILVSRQYGGFFLSTDGGNNFTNPLNVQDGHAINFCPTMPSRVIGTIQDYDFNKSAWFEAAVVSNDFGATWTRATGPLNYLAGFGRIETYPLLNDSNTVYASAFDGYIYKSLDGGQSYAKVTTSGSAGTSWYANALWVDPTNSKRLVIGGTYVYGSTDGGVTLNRIGAGYIQTDQPHPDVHFFIPAPGYDGVSNKTLYVCTDGGLYKTTDITTASTSAGWSRLDQGIVTTQYYSIAGDGPSGRIIGGLQDNGTQSNVVGNAQANYIYGGDGGYVAIDSTNPLYVFGEYIYLELFRNSNGGVNGNTSTSIYNGLSDAGTHANFIAPFILDPNQPTTLLAGGTSLWRTTNDREPSPTWTIIRPAASSAISAIAVAKGNSDIIWVGQNDGSVSVTTNGTSGAPNWRNIESGGVGPLPNRYVTRILVDPDNSDTVYITYGGFTPDNIYKTTDGGTTWKSVTGAGDGALPSVPVRAIARRPGSPNTLYAGTEIGLFSTLDGGKTWTTSSDMNVNVSIDELAYMNNSNTLLAGTHGRGVWLLPYVTAKVANITLNPSTTVGGTSSIGTVLIQSPAPANGVLISLTSSSTLASLPESVFFPAGATTATFTITTLPTEISTPVEITASRDSSSISATLNVIPPSLFSLSFYPTNVPGGNSDYGTVTLNGPAPAGGVTVALSTTSTAGSIPASATVPEGSTSFTFPVTTHPVSVTTPFPVTAKLDKSSQSATLTIVPPSVTSISIDPNPVVGGNNAKLTVKLNGAAPAAGTTVGLTSSSADAIPPATATVPAGSTTTQVVLATRAVASGESVTLTAKTGTVTQSTSLVIQTNSLVSVALSQQYVVGGSDTAVQGTVTFNGPAPAKGQTVLLKSSNSTVLAVPASVKLAAGSTLATFASTHHLVTGAQQITVTATYGDSSVNTQIAIIPMALYGVTVVPTSVAGGASSTGTVTLIAPAGVGTGAITVKLTNSNSPIAIPSTVVVPIHKSSATFTIASQAVSQTSTAVITAALNGGTKQAILTITPVPIASITLAPGTVKGSATTVVTGTVTLATAAPTGGITVTLSSANPAIAATPATVIVAAGKKTATFKVTHKAVTAKTTVQISGAAGGVTKSATLTLTP